jgi:hypothetical protein
MALADAQVLVRHHVTGLCRSAIHFSSADCGEYRQARYVRREERKSVLSDKFKMLKMKKVGRDQGMKLTMLWCSQHRNPVDFSQCRQLMIIKTTRGAPKLAS